MLIGAVANMGAQGIEDYTGGNSFQWQNYAGAAVGGAMGVGAILLNPLGGAVTAGAITGGSEDLATQFFSNGTDIDYLRTGGETLRGAAFGQVTKYIKVPSLSSGRNSIQAISNSTFTKISNGSIQNFSGKTGAKVFAGQMFGNTPQSLYNGGSSNKKLQNKINSLYKQLKSLLQKQIKTLKKNSRK